MFPFVFEWIWDMSHFVFMGGAAFALTVIGIGMTYCIIKSSIDASGKGDESKHH